MNYKCLVVDDDITIAENTAEYFNMFDISTAYVTSYDAAIDFLEVNETSLVLLDINLGDKSGFELCKRIRKDYDMPILFISARKSDDDILTALNIGGDDYISKPFTLNILLAKVKAILARYEKATEAAKAAPMKTSEAADEDGKLKVTDDISLDTSLHKLLRSGESIGLKVMEYKMLLYLLENRGRVVTKDELLKNVWEDEFIGEGTLAVHARHIREKMEDDPKEPAILKTVWGVGYIIE
ncbi:MAG: response regulator transcription factor [Clostridiales bacterium]|nr:response regulator transcription factor [Clostridiales bacterium]